jgi:hypothetical protein
MSDEKGGNKDLLEIRWVDMKSSCWRSAEVNGEYFVERGYFIL